MAESPSPHASLPDQLAAEDARIVSRLGLTPEQDAELRETADTLARNYRQSLPADYLGHYSKLGSPLVIQTLLRASAAGLPDSDACAAAGMHFTTLQTWQRIAAEEPTGIHSAFLREMKRAKSAGRVRCLERIFDAGEKPHLWASQAWLLERGDPEHWAIRRDTDTTQARIVVQIGVRDSEIIIGSSAPSPQVLTAQPVDTSFPVNTTPLIGHAAAQPQQGAEGALALPAGQPGADARPSELGAATEPSGGTLPPPLHASPRVSVRSKPRKARK